MKYKISGKVLFAFLILAFSHVASADTISITATNSGWYFDNGSHAEYTEPSIFTGVCITCPYVGEARSFFLFDLSSVSGTVVSAELRISTGSTAGSFGQFYTDDSYETYSLYEISHDPSILPIGELGNTALFDDLGTGVTYGAYNVSSPLDLYISIALTADAINDINNSGTLFGMGGAISTLDNDLTRTQYAFGGTHLGTQTRELILTTVVPVPAALWLMVSGLFMLVGVIRK